MHLSRRVTELKASATVGVINRAAALRAKGVDIVTFAAGEPDFDTPEPIKRAAVRALERGETKYMPTAGDPETRRAIAAKLTAENGIPGVTPDHIVITTGGKHALYLLMQALLDPPAHGEQSPWDVILPVPAWVSYDPIARLAGGNVVELPTIPETDFKITPDQLAAAITPRARVLVLNSPSNPCGTMYTPDELRALAGVVERAARSAAPDLLIITDEIYEKIIYGGIPHFSIGSVPAIAERTITVNGMSKAYAMTGWRVGYLAGSGEFGLKVAQAASKLQGQMTTNITSFVYPAIRAALAECAGDVERMRQAFAARARLVYGLMSALPAMPCPRPTGAFYLFPDASAHFGKTSAGGQRLSNGLDLANALLDEARVAVVPGDDFGGCGRNHLRFSFACSEEEISKGMERVGTFIAGLK